ncbi:hypothetical protein Ahy_B05g078467 isoform B [Arachis hypogaea]|uniref:Uncharacterized protein n=1 Tax=Arachis hypogaea TaxID=3818 RepID=A0A444Z766_ARAHY|nr:hypothetical protein Ahy_B05g078467 isoform B [Arachis hypogaea]
MGGVILRWINALDTNSLNSGCCAITALSAPSRAVNTLACSNDSLLPACSASCATRGPITLVSLAGNVLANEPIDFMAGIRKDGLSTSLIILKSCSTTALAAGELVLNAARRRSALDSAAAVISIIVIKQLYCSSPCSFSTSLAKQSIPLVSVIFLLLVTLPLASIHKASAQLTFS